MQSRYEVALWLRAPGGAAFPEYVAVVRVSCPLVAVAVVMQHYGLCSVVYAAVAVVGCSDIVRFLRGVRIRKGTI